MEETAPLEPRVSAIIVSHNRAADLRRALAALNQSKDRDRLEILVVDCGSSDDSPRLDAEFENITILRLPHHFGAARALNIAIRTARGEFVFLVDPAVEVAPDTVLRLCEKLDSEPELAAVCPLLVDDSGAPANTLQTLPKPGAVPEPKEVDITQESVAVESVGLEALMVRRQFIQGMNYFDARYGHYWLDAELAMQIRRSGKKIRLYPAIRTTLHDFADALAEDPHFLADRDLGLSTFLGKHYGFGAGLSSRLGAIFRALLHFEIARLSALISGKKVDQRNPA
jgi:GT2 family glycosyltransferase